MDAVEKVMNMTGDDLVREAARQYENMNAALFEIRRLVSEGSYIYDLARWACFGVGGIDLARPRISDYSEVK